MTSRVAQALAWLGGQIPTLLVLGSLIALYIWGVTNDWKLPTSKPPGPEEKKPAETEGAVTPGPVTLAENDTADLAGIEIDKARRQAIGQTIEAPAQIAFDQTRYAHLAPRAAGTAWRVLRNPGEQVKVGDVLALISAPEVARAKADFLTAHIQHEIRARTLERYQQASSSIPERQLREAELAVREARIRLVNDQQALLNLGLSLRPEDLRNQSDEQVARKVRLLGLPAGVDGDEVPGNLLPLNAPFAGLVVRRDMVVGEVVGPSQPAFVVADTRRLWILIDVRLEDAERLEVGQPVTFRSSATGQNATGPLTWISPEVDVKTRTVRARAEVYNPAGRLRPATFGRATVEVARREAVTVPTSALQWDGRCYRVFVRVDAKTFEPRLALPGSRTGERTELLDPAVLLPAGLVASLGGPVLAALTPAAAGPLVLETLRPGQVVVTAGSHVLKSEMLKGRIGGED